MTIDVSCVRFIFRHEAWFSLGPRSSVPYGGSWSCGRGFICSFVLDRDARAEGGCNGAFRGQSTRFDLMLLLSCSPEISLFRATPGLRGLGGLGDIDLAYQSCRARGDKSPSKAKTPVNHRTKPLWRRGDGVPMRICIV